MSEEKKIRGCDLSSWNGADAVDNAVKQFPDIEFVICKASEGRTFRDITFDKKVSDALGHQKVVGAYHYARPDRGNTAEEEAYNFVEAVKPYVGKMFFALDWEDKSLNYDVEWALEWCMEVERMTGVKPMIYVQESAVASLGTTLVNNDYGLWVAKWSDNKPKTGHWPVWAIWQYTNEPFDLDWFNGSREQLEKYTKSSTVEDSDEEDFDEGHFCGCCCCKLRFDGDE